MIRRIVSLGILLWALGFALFVITLPGEAGAHRTDGIIVFTGGPGRIQRGLDHLGRGEAKRMLVSGVDPAVRPAELARLQDAPRGLFACCVDLGKEAIDTRSNATEAARWLKRKGYTSVRLVTTDWHMPRAHFELRRQVREDVIIMQDSVDSAPGFLSLVSEYNKYLLRRISALVGV